MEFKAGVRLGFTVVVKLRLRVRDRVGFRVEVRVGFMVRVGSRCKGSSNYSNIYYPVTRPYASLFHHCINENLRSISRKDQMLIPQIEFVLTDL